MIPGMNNRQMQQMMKRMGMQQQEIDATQVIIRTPDKEIVIENPQVSRVNMMGQETFQVTGQIVEQEVETAAEISAEDIITVAQQTGVTPEEAASAIQEADGDLAQAILNITEKKQEE